MTTEKYKAAATYWTQKKRAEMPADEYRELLKQALESCGGHHH